ncbi:MAG TPA: Mrp/NBP35 family ATP-binding protein [Bacillota bacterium]|nr:Mrp/NBP35 family ATP-binding protein [Bacillota bacterium]
MPVDKREVIRALGRAKLAGAEQGAIAQGLVQDVVVDGDSVRVYLFDKLGGKPIPQEWPKALQQAVQGVPGVKAAIIEMRAAGTVPTAQPQRGRPLVHLAENTAVLAVASGKGGVGKSTITANLAVALSDLGYRVGALDADIYGFSLPSLLGSREAPEMTPERRILPTLAEGVSLMSMDYFVPGNKPVVWRGPMLGKALQQFLTDVEWGDLDFLVLDLPPGTGDIALDVHEMLPNCSELIVTTPDPLAARVAVRAGQMAQTTNHPLLGVVENMSFLPCDRGPAHRPFGSGGGDAVAKELAVPLLAEVPLGSARRVGTGVFTKDSEAGRIFRSLGEKVAQSLGAAAD